MINLDDFAERPIPEATHLPAVVTNAAPPPMIVHGAQLIAGNKRDPRATMDEIDAMASMMGEDVFYSIPFKDRKKGTITHVEGISIDGAMMVHNAYGNAGVHAWVHNEGYDYWDILAIWQDHERGIEVSRMFRQRKNASRMGGGDDARNQEAALQIGISKAQRNVIANALKYLCNRAYRVAKSGLSDKIGKDPDGWRKKIVDRLAATNIPLDRVEAVIGRPAKDWLVLDIVKVIERAKAVTDGEATLDDTFPAVGPAPADKALEKFANSTGQVSSPAGEAATPITSPPATGVAATPEIKHIDPGPYVHPDERGKSNPGKAELTHKLLQLASGPEGRLDKLDSLELANGMYEDLYKDDPDTLDFANKACVMIAKVIKDDLPIKDAQKYLEAMAKT